MSEGRALRAGVIGLGAMGVNHARVYRELPGVELAAVADPDEVRVAAVTAQAGGVRGFAGAAAMLRDGAIDLVSLCAPTSEHLAIALEVVARGVPVLVEKPLAATYTDGVRLRDAAGGAGVPLMVGHIERFNPAVIELKARVQAGELGRVLQIHARRVGPFPERVRDVGVVLDLAPHDIDVMRFVTGSEVVRVQAETEQRIATEREDTLSGLLRFENGVVGVLDVNWLTPTKIRELSVLGERGMFVVDELARELTFFENDFQARAEHGGWAAQHQKGVTEGPVHVIAIDKREPLRVELEAFARAVRDGTPPPVSADDGLAAIAVAEALVEAGRRGAAVALPAREAAQ